MYNKVILKLARVAINWGLVQLYYYIDMDDNGELSTYEIQSFIEDIRSKLTAIKRKI